MVMMSPAPAVSISESLLRRTFQLVNKVSIKVTQALLAGRKLLLADDSITIQKVVDLTFADEGVEVLCVSNGRDAIDRLAEFQPDVVLADVFMPQVNGYEVCEYIKQNEQLRHIPVMLLVGSFEPFNEAEARRVGADDTLTKPFQSIRNLIDKVSSLVSGRPADEQIPTAELPQVEEHEREPEPEPERLTEAEIDIVTADTQPLPMELSHMMEESVARNVGQEGGVPEHPDRMDTGKTETQTTGAGREVSEEVSEAGSENVAGDIGSDMPLELGEGGFGPGTSNASDEFVLDIDLDDDQDAASYQPSAYVRQPIYKSPSRERTAAAVASKIETATADQLALTQEFPTSISEAAKATKLEAKFAAAQPTVSGADAGAQRAGLEGISPEVIDAIARRAVEQLSEKVVREIAWEVVPDLAELLIKQQLEDKKT